jgi:predicted permease
MWERILPALPLLLLFLLGYLLRKISFFDEGGLKALKRVVSDLALPALLFGAFRSLEFNQSYLVLIAAIFLVCVIMLILAKPLGAIIKVKNEAFPFMMGGFEMGMLGYALFTSFYGEAHLGKMALVDLGQVLFVFTILMTLLIRHKGQHFDFGTLVLRIITSPVMIAIILGLLANARILVLRSNAFTRQLDEVLDILASLTMPLIALSIGYGIRITKESLGSALKTIVARKVVLLVFAVVINLLIVRLALKMDRIYEMAVLLMFLMPSPFIVSIYIDDKKKNLVDYVDTTLSLDSVVSIFAVMGAVLLLG